MWFIGVEVELETSAPCPKKNPGSAPVAVAARGKSYRIGHLFTQEMIFLCLSYPTCIQLSSCLFVSVFLVSSELEGKYFFIQTNLVREIETVISV